MKKLLILLSGLLSLAATAQTDIDAFRFSQRSIAGTARYVSMGGAFGAVGGDLSVMSFNPAGLGVYRSSEFSLSPSIYTGNTNADYLDGNTVDGRTVFNFGNAGCVFTSRPRNSGKDDWVSWNFGIAYNRLADFNNVHSLEGFNTRNSIADYFAEQSEGTDFDDLDEFKEYLSYYTFVTDTEGTRTHYVSAIPNGQMLQRRTAESRGSLGETNFAFSGNYANKLYLGASLGITYLRYTEDMTYEEIDTENRVDSMDRFRYSTYQNTEGSGINFKMGFIYRPVDFFRFGAAIHTPTLFDLSDNYSSNMVARFDGGTRLNKESPNGAYDYEFVSPFRATAGMAFIFGKWGLASVDYEYTDMADARLRGVDYGFTSENSDIRRKYTTTHSLRAGTEWRLDKVSLRAGYGYTSSPISDSYRVDGWDFSGQHISGGIGFREKSFYIDLAYLYSFSDQYLQPYTLENQFVEGSYEHVTGYNFTATFGVKF